MTPTPTSPSSAGAAPPSTPPANEILDLLDSPALLACLRKHITASRIAPGSTTELARLATEAVIEHGGKIPEILRNMEYQSGYTSAALFVSPFGGPVRDVVARREEGEEKSLKKEDAKKNVVVEAEAGAVGVEKVEKKKVKRGGEKSVAVSCAAARPALTKGLPVETETGAGRLPRTRDTPAKAPQPTPKVQNSSKAQQKTPKNQDSSKKLPPAPPSPSIPTKPVSAKSTAAPEPTPKAQDSPQPQPKAPKKQDSTKKLTPAKEVPKKATKPASTKPTKALKPTPTPRATPAPRPAAPSKKFMKAVRGGGTSFANTAAPVAPGSRKQGRGGEQGGERTVKKPRFE